MKKLFLLIVFAFAFLNLTKANVSADSILVNHLRYQVAQY